MASTDIPGMPPVKDECPGTSALEQGKFARNSAGKTVVRVADDDALSVLENILLALGGGVAFHVNDSDVSIVAGTPLEVLSSTVAGVSNNRVISRVRVTSRAAGSYTLKLNGGVIGSGRLNAAELNNDLVFTPGFNTVNGDVISVEFTMLHGKVGQDIEVYLMATDT